MSSTFPKRLQRSFLVVSLLAVAILPPVLLPALRPFYAPIYDHLVLPLIGYTWHLYYPYSALILLPLAVFLTGFWLAWLGHMRLISTAQLHLTTRYLHTQPEAGAYLFFKRMQLFWIAGASRLKAPYRSWYPFSKIPRQYDISAVSQYVSVVYHMVLEDWIRRYQLLPAGASNKLISERIIKGHSGLAQIHVPSIVHMEQVSTPNLVQAITHLDNAQIYGADHGDTLQHLFRLYILRTAHVDVEGLAVHRLLTWLQEENDLDRTILLRTLINLWFDTPSPVISRIVIGEVSSYMDQADHLLEAWINNDSSNITASPLPNLTMRSFADRYIHFLEKSRGPAAAIHIRDALAHLASKAKFLERADKKGEDTDEGACHIIRDLIDLLSDASGYQQATAWQTRQRSLHTFQTTADEAIWTALYHTNQPDTFNQMEHTPEPPA